ncbi:alpha-tubulin N-acetyltransferase isoform X1 [Spodoptera frugiperda]|uniref:Alpha-tubulin N-acetyltransferase n=1 Tax=Spodoptera frugiperda TaxID=7108 RepID=A0A9R0DE71_SPOFR|nr:alpha-tubulin N-acetyltransferase isoform X1 [Spodoptera frugiperda]
MDWAVPGGMPEINDVFDEVTKITSDLLPKNYSGDVRSTRAVQDLVARIIDQLGEESAAAQGLNKVITSSEKLRKNPGHIVYLLKDHRGKEGKGEIIGLLKVGRKHLFLFDNKEVVHEVEPLCVLDFYVVRDRQRMGFGRMLFDHMLHELEVMAWQMAIDGPSEKMEKFLSRNFGIEKLIRQNNNFAVAPNFFDRSDDEISNSGGGLSAVPTAAVGRFAAPKPASAIANVIHGAGHEHAARRSESAPVPEDEAPEASAAVANEGQPIRYYPEELWDDDDWEEPSEPEYDAEEFDPDQPPAERGDDLGARGAIRYSPVVVERPGSLAVQQAAALPALPAQPAPAAPPPADLPAAGLPSAGASAAGTPAAGASRRDSQLTDKGYFDVKYYHNKLW